MNRAWFVCASLVVGCGAGAVPEEPTASASLADDSVAETSGAQTHAAADGSAPATTPQAAAAGEVAIDRARLVTVVDGGLGRVLQQITTEPHMENGRFVGFRVLAVGERWRELVPVQVGDTVTRINGAPISRPEQAQQAFDGLRVASELVVEFMRGGEVRVVRFAIQ